MKYNITEARKTPEIPTFGHGGARGYGAPGGGGYLWVIFLVATAIIVATQVKKEPSGLNIPGNDELFEKLPDNAKEAFKEKYGQPVFLLPGNSIGMSQADWKRLLKELK